MNAIASKKRMLAPMAVLSVLAMLCVALVGVSDSDGATGGNLTGYGTVNEISIAPGYSWTYTSTFPADLEEGTVLTFQVNEMDDTATIDGHTLKISTIPASMAGNAYNIVLKAYHAESDQTAYQWIRITVNAAMSVNYSGCLSEIVKGTSQSIDLKSEGGIGAVTWTATTMAPGLTLSGTKITGTPTQVGANTIVLKATSSQGESKDLTINFTVYNVIVGGNDEQIVAIGGKSVASATISQTGTDLGVTWTADKALPAGLSLDKDTGVISGTYTGTTSGQAVITLTGTSAHGPAQTATKKVTINYEPAFAISGGNDKVLTYTGNTVAKTVGLSISAASSAITWSIPETAGITISQDGKLTITGEAAVTADGKITVTARSANGQTATKTVSYLVEDTLKITGASKLVGKQGVAASEAYTISGGSSNTVKISENAYGEALTFANGKLSITYPDSHASEKVTLTVTSAAGQTATIDVNVVVYSTMGFSSNPGATGVFAFAE